MTGCFEIGYIRCYTSARIGGGIMRGIVRIVSVSSGILVLCASLAAAQPPDAQQPGAPGRGGPPAAPKNLKVLPKAWTGQQVRALMQTFAESLGVRCEHCHALDRKAAPPAGGRRPTRD